MTSAYLTRLDNPPGKDEDRVIVLQKGSFVVYIGCNALSNESIVKNHPHRDCLVLHAWGARGSYVILCKKDHPGFSDDMIRFAAETALKHSKSELKAVSYGYLSDLAKPENVPPGVFRWVRVAQIEL